MSAISAGSLEVAQHLLYYSELRAAHALLFRHGIVLLNKKNFVVTSRGTRIIPFPADASGIAMNSHQAIWVIFKRWARSAAAADFCGATLRMRGETLDRWVSERPNGASLSSIVGPLMEQWGMDINRFSDDRALRNQLSYNPTRLEMSLSGVSPAYIADLHQRVWMLLEPSSANAFEVLDRYIIRQAFDAFAAQSGPRRRVATKSGQDLVQSWVAKVLGSGDSYLIDFLNRAGDSGDPEILDLAGRDLSSDPLGRRMTGMVGRALILLRLASGATKGVMDDAGGSPADYRFWVEDLLTTHGVEVPDLGQDYLDLYQEIEESSLDLEPLLKGGTGIELSEVAISHAYSLHVLSTFERVPVWAVA